ncbi:MAG TPA: ATP-binding protein [Terriglobales bacterium]|nr:ATP-binding protein [Terriglobales bacterium]
MSRKAKIVLAITFMVAVLVSAFSYFYISEILAQKLTSAYEMASLLTAQLYLVATTAVPDLSSTRIDTSNPDAVREAIAGYLQEDQNLNDMMASAVGNWLIVYDVSIVDANGRAILDSNPDLNNKPLPQRSDLKVLRDTGFWQQLKILYRPATVYDVSMPLALNGAPFGTARVGISTVFLRNELTPRLQRAAYFSLVSILLSLLLAAAVSNLALGPLKQISRNLDVVSAGETRISPEQEAEHDEYGLVTLKIAHLGRQIREMRDTNQIFSALKENVEQVMAKLQDGLMLFTSDARVVLVSASVERFLVRPRHEILGHAVDEIFSSSTQMGAAVLQAFHQHRSLAQHEIEGENGKRVQVTLEFIEESGTPIGALLTMRDAESVRRIEDEIEMSRRLSASGRLTRGVGHEVKNPINAIVLHLQLLQSKLQKIDPDTRRHMDIIGKEIQRLDRVVQILVDFTRPRELHLEEMDLRRLLEDVASLAGPDAEQHGVTIVRDIPQEPMMVKVDSDFIKQAFLNVVLNGVQAMPNGGTLTIAASREEETVLTEIRDEGGGIPPDIQDKIFELYFTTKKGGSGIGLAQTYQIMQWHYGAVDFESREGEGTTFRMRVPLAESLLDALKEVSARE